MNNQNENERAPLMEYPDNITSEALTNIAIHSEYLEKLYKTLLKLKGKMYDDIEYHRDKYGGKPRKWEILTGNLNDSLNRAVNRRDNLRNNNNINWNDVNNNFVNKCRAECDYMDMLETEINYTYDNHFQLYRDINEDVEEANFFGELFG